MKPQRGKGTGKAKPARRRRLAGSRGRRAQQANPQQASGAAGQDGTARARPPAVRGGKTGGALRWWVPWLASFGTLLWLLVLVNAALPLARCTAVWGNKLLFLAVMLVPWYWLRLVRHLPRPRWRWGVAAAALAGGLAGPLLAWRSGSWSTERKEISAVNLPAGGRVVARAERSPGSPYYRMVARQEREFMPGVMIVRNLARHSDARGGLVELLDSDTVRIRPARVIGEVPAVVRDLKPWGWW